jgi:2,5-diketo-D-gluconate reductase B
MSMSKIAYLYDNTPVPLLGLGTWQLTGDTCYNIVRQALEIGYRHIDTAHIYGNHVEIGHAIKDSGINRNELYITTKLWRNEMQQESVKMAAMRALQELGVDYIDLYLIHWPNSSVQLNHTFAGLDQLKKDGIIKHHGVSNFTIHHLEDSLRSNKEIAVNQVEFHPSLYQKELLDYCKAHQIVLTAYSPIGHGKDLEIQEIIELAKKYDKTPAQICISWCLSKDLITIPKASSKERLQENFDAQNFTISPDDIDIIDNLGLNNRYINPGFAEFDY